MADKLNFIPPSVNKVIVQALAGNNVAQLKNAREKCRAVLKNQPGNAVLLRIMGMIEFQLGNIEPAAKWFKKALTILPDSADLHLTYAKILAAQKKYDEAVIAFKCSITLQPNCADAYNGLGTVFKECGDEENAVKAYNDAIAIDPNHPSALNNLGVILKNKGALTDAANCFSRAIAAKPDYPLPLNNLGFLYFTSGNMELAEDLYHRALALAPDYPDALSNLGMVLHDRGAFAESIALYKKALALQPNHANALNNLGTILHHQGAFEESISLYKKVLTLQPKHPEALNNLGNALRALGKLPEAIAAYERAIALKDDYAEYHNNLSMALLAAGRFDEGWKEQEWRWKTTQFAAVRLDMGKPLWQGEAAIGRILLIRAEQGFGDTLQFCRYAPLAAARGLRVLLEVQPALVKLMESLAGVEQVIAQGQPLPEFDLYCPMMSLPAAFHTQLETIPSNGPYLSARDECISSWRNRLSNADSNQVKIGLVWSGSARFNSPDLIATNLRRSIPPDLLTPLTDVPGILFYSLQKNGPPASKEFGLIDYMNECNDFADTAAFIENLDLVISVDTAVAHLAGALGKQVWLLNRFDSCWRWFRNREDSPWYPTLRLFRQPRPGDWQSVMAYVKNELERIASGQSGIR